MSDENSCLKFLKWILMSDLVAISFGFPVIRGKGLAYPLWKTNRQQRDLVDWAV